ncbi:PepSY domain-containing protein [Shewanella sp. SNU WT4]|uniref:PepSY domain-containing protein n=1 Tax=Shewanella sp. SNU WT4 TaxID=2590015 RepID=UPI001125E241|nr:PepSY domain-containing protein [Shewanella sp. SNU WT4]QDF65412.1 PepSY domain-containing protein [Shewanella sp. SNU WT4]
MKPWLYGLGLLLPTLSLGALADANLYKSLNQSDVRAPLNVIAEVAQLSPGVVSEFETRLEDKGLVYQIELVDTKDKSHTEFVVNAETGQVLHKFTSKLQAKDMAEYRAANSLVASNHKMKQLLTSAIGKNTGKLIYMKLDNDLGINYLEFTILNGSKAQTQAFDIDRMQPIPLLTRH